MSGDLVQIPVEVPTEVVVFDVVTRGYRRPQVDAHVAKLEQELAELRWEHDDLDSRRRELARDRARFTHERENWQPSYTALGSRACEILTLAEAEAAQLRESVADDVRQLREDADTEVRAVRRRLAEQVEQARTAAARELAAVQQNAADQRQLVDTELTRARRDAELTAAGLIARATARAEEQLAAAQRDTRAHRDAAAAELAATLRRRDALRAELADLSTRMAAVVERFQAPDQ